jgi:hypothetical protein
MKIWPLSLSDSPIIGTEIGMEVSAPKAVDPEKFPPNESWFCKIQQKH